MMNDLLRIPPSRDLLMRFFHDPRRAIAVHEAARLVGWPHTEVRRQAEAEGVLLGEQDLVRWDAVAGWLLDSWPLRSLFETLGTDSGLLPRGLQLLPVQWELPAYIVHGLLVQSQLEPLPHRVVRPSDLTGYLWDVLHRALDADTVARLQGDREFMDAYEFPNGETDE
jgi:hypothetical protein